MKLRKLLNELTVPNILYHGTDSKFTTFNDSKPIFFTDNIQVAKSYGSNVIKVQLKLDNPLEIDCDGNSTCVFRGKNYLPSKLAEVIKELSDDLKKYGRLDDEEMDELEYEYDWSNSWTLTMGDSDEPVYDCKEIEQMFQDWLSKNVTDNSTQKRKTTCYCGNPIDYSNPNCDAYSLCKDHAMDV